MFDAGSLKLYAAIAIFCAVSFIGTAALENRSVAGRTITRGQAQFVAALIGLIVGISFLTAMG